MTIKDDFRTIRKRELEKISIDILVRDYTNIRDLRTRLNSFAAVQETKDERRVVNRDSDNENGGLKKHFIFFISVFSPINFTNKFPPHHATFETRYSKLNRIEKQKKKISYRRKQLKTPRFLQSRRESKKIFNVSNIKRLLFEQIQIDKKYFYSKFYVIFF